MSARVGKFRESATLGLATLHADQVDHPAPFLFRGTVAAGTFSSSVRHTSGIGPVSHHLEVFGSP